jgi:hypothetical protein
VQAAWLQAHSMSDRFSTASHWALQYFPEVIMQEQTGCAHFTAFELSIVSSQVDRPHYSSETHLVYRPSRKTVLRNMKHLHLPNRETPYIGSQDAATGEGMVIPVVKFL